MCETHLTAMKRHLPCGITECYVPACQVNAHRLNPS